MRRLLPTRIGALALAAVLVAAVLAGAAPARAVDDPGASMQWGLQRIGADAGWGAGRGEGMVIAVVDTGVDLAHEDLAGQLVAGHDFVDDDDVPQDGHGHGTHVAGIAAAATGNGRGVAGVAPGARIMPLRVLGNDGKGDSGDVVAAIRHAADQGADVINLSLGEKTDFLLGSSFSGAIRYAWSKGAVPVISAGNDYVLDSSFRDEPALVVAATTRGDGKPTYSSGVGAARWGVAAPGGETPTPTSPERAIYSTYWTRDRKDVYAYQAGTSMSAPHVAGAVAVLRSLGLSPREAVDHLLATAVDLGAPGRDATFGAGRIDLAAAVAATGRAPAPQEPPPTTATPSTSAPPPANAGSAGPAATTIRRPTTSTTTGTASPTSTAATVPSPEGVALPASPDDGAPRPGPAATDELAAPRAGPGDDDAPPAALLALAGLLAALAGAGTWRRWSHLRAGDQSRDIASA